MCVDWGTRISYEARRLAQNHARVRKAERNKEKVPKRFAMQAVTNGGLGARALPVSYTHLTLPTIYSV